MTATLVLGGARSGKSRHAEALAAGRAGPLVYIASAEALDAEMAARIGRHRARRDGRWVNVEAPLEVADAVAAHDRPGGFILFDCVTLWLANLMAAGRDPEGETELLCERIGELSGDLVVVSNEVGSGIVPDNALARAFRDAAGLANQRLAQACDRVVLVAAGLPLVLKGTDS